MRMRECVSGRDTENERHWGREGKECADEGFLGERHFVSARDVGQVQTGIVRSPAFSDGDYQILLSQCGILETVEHWWSS